MTKQSDAIGVSTRQSSFELLRIIAIFLIVLYHFVLHTAADYLTGSLTLNSSLEALYHLGGKFGVNLFVLLTGYFGWKNRFRFKRLFDIELQTYFYCMIGLALYSALIMLGEKTLSYTMILKLLLPVSFSAYWFITAYMGLCLLSPFINKILNSINLKSKLVLCILLALMMFVFPFFRSASWANYLTRFIALYVFGAFLGMHKDKVLETISRKAAMISFCSSYIIAWGGSMVLLVLQDYLPMFKGHTNYLASDRSPLLLAAALCLFIFFMHTDIGSNPKINKLGKLTLGVYLIQSNPVISGVLWACIKKMNLHELAIWPFLAVVITAGVCVACFIIEALRANFFRQTKLDKISFKFFDYIDDWMSV